MSISLLWRLAIGGIKMKQIFRERRNEPGANRMNSMTVIFIIALAFSAAPLAAQQAGGYLPQPSDPEIWDIARGGQLYDD